MDDQITSSKSSLKKELNKWIILTASIFAILVSVISGIIAYHEAKEYQDEILSQIANLVENGKITTGKIQRKDDDEPILIINLNNPTDPISKELTPLSLGFHDISLHNEQWRCFIISFSQTKHFAIAQPTKEREETAFANALNVMLPIIMLTVFMLLIINFIINSKLDQLTKLSLLLQKHGDQQTPFLPQDQVFNEIVPFINSINQLFSKLQLTLNSQRRFIADAAHEMRTPVTALSLQAENLLGAKDEADLNNRIATLNSGFTRLRSLVAQLLNLARLQNQIEDNKTTVDFKRLLTEVIEEIYPLVQASERFIKITQISETKVFANENELKQLIRNVLDNAIRYGIDHEVIEISLSNVDNIAKLSVKNKTLSFDKDEISHLGDPFYRPNQMKLGGNGLGLAICFEIAKKHNGKIELRCQFNKYIEVEYSQPTTSQK